MTGIAIVVDVPGGSAGSLLFLKDMPKVSSHNESAVLEFPEVRGPRRRTTLQGVLTQDFE
jgi:hypothetical protein